MTDDDRGGDRSAARLFQQCRAVRLDQDLELGEDVALLARDLTNPRDEGPSDSQLWGAWQPRELATELREDLWVLQRCRPELGLDLRRGLTRCQRSRLIWRVRSLICWSR